MPHQIKYILLVIIVLGHTTMASRILAVFPYPSYSHQIVHHTLTQALARQGHELIVFTADPMNKNITNYSEVSLNFLYKEFSKRFNFIEINHLGIWKLLEELYKFGGIMCDAVYSHPKMQHLLSSKESSGNFDLIIVSGLYWDSLYYLSDLFNAPLIGMTTLSDSMIPLLMGNPMLCSYIPHVLTGYSDEMTFRQRIHNCYVNGRILWEYYRYSLPVQDQVLKKHFGNDIPSISEMVQRVSMLFINNHPHLNYVRSFLPNILRIGGLHSAIVNTSLPTDLKMLLDNSTQGFIYFSLGTNVKSHHLSNYTLNSFIHAFSELPYQIIWKLDSENLVGKSQNIYIKKWMPQEGILAHPNIKLFIYQGGLQSSEEAVNNGVPMLGFPIYSDQWYNLNLLIKRGVARGLDINSIDKDVIKTNIQNMISNSSYRDNIISLRKLLHDRPQHPIKEAIWWVEHVIRHKGARHLRTHSQDLPWYITELADIFGFFALLLVVLFLLGRILCRLAIAMIKVQGSSRFDKINVTSTMKKKTKSS